MAEQKKRTFAAPSGIMARVYSLPLPEQDKREFMEAIAALKTEERLRIEDAARNNPDRFAQTIEEWLRVREVLNAEHPGDLVNLFIDQAFRADVAKRRLKH